MHRNTARRIGTRRQTPAAGSRRWRLAALSLVLQLAALVGASTAGAQTPFIQVALPNGVALDGAGNVIVHHDTGTQNVVTAFSPAGQPLAQVPIGGFTDISRTGQLAIDPATGTVLDFLQTGELVAIDFQNGQPQLLVDLRAIGFDATRVVDITTNSVRNFSGMILPGSTTFGDLAIWRRGDQLDIFVSGVSVVTPFVARVRLLPGPVQAEVLVASIGTTAGNRNQPRGVAVTPQGTVVTTLPIAGDPARCQAINPANPPGCFFDIGFAFPASLQPGQSGSVRALLNGQDLASQGMTADAAGNVYVATGAVGSSACGVGGSGALVVLPAALNTLRCLNLNQVIAESRDVAVTPAGDRAFMTVINLGAVVAF